MIDLTFILYAILAALGGAAIGAAVFFARRWFSDAAAEKIDELLSQYAEGAMRRLRKKYGDDFEFESSLPEAVTDALNRVTKDAPKWLKRSGWSMDALADLADSWLRSRFGD